MDSDQQSTLLQPTAVSHPGEVVADYLEFHGWGQRDLARRTGLTPKTISEICNGKAPVTAATALALEKVLQRPASAPHIFGSTCNVNSTKLRRDISI